jgi:thiamine-phosphate pyrophosphorylase
MLKGLYAITDEHLTPDETIFSQVEESLRAGVNIIQYRDKTKTDYEVEETCRGLQALCRNYNALFIIDDRPYLAQKIKADGLHIGKNDITLSEARNIFTDGIIGVSCYGSVARAEELEKEGASYVAFGSFFPSPTKPKSGIISTNVLNKAKQRVNVPVCAIGGITLENISEIAQHKPEMISVVSAVFKGNIKENVETLLKGMKI